MEKNNIKKQKHSKRETASRIIMCGPITVWTVLFIVLPVALLVFMSFLTKGSLGRIEYRFTLKNYAEIFNPAYLNVLKESVLIAFWTTLVTILLGYPLAMVMSKLRKKTSGIVAIAIMLPLWVSGLIITYSLVIMLNSSGTVNSFLMGLGIIKHPLQLLYNSFAVIVGMVYMFMPFAVLPMYSSIEKLDPAVIEASEDLGASPARTFFKVQLPLTSPGIFAAIILTFIPCIGYYMIADMLGGGKSMLIGNLIYRQFTVSRNWPFGAALSVVLAAIILIMVRIYTSRGGSMDDLA